MIIDYYLETELQRENEFNTQSYEEYKAMKGRVSLQGGGALDPRQHR